jgi:integrase
MKEGRKVKGVFQRDGQWWIRWACTLGHDHRKPSGDLKMVAVEEHQQKRAEVRDARKAGRQCCPKLTVRERPMTAETLIDDFLAHSKINKRSYRDDLPKAERFKTLFKGRLATDITVQEIEDFKAAFAEGKAPATVNLYLRFLKAVFNRAIKHGRLQHNPVRAVPLYQEHNARTRCLSPDEESRLLEHLPPGLRPLVVLALNTGMRKGELLGLRWTAIDWDTRTLKLHRDKAGAGRSVVLNSAAFDALLTVKREQKVMGPFVFASPRGKFLANLERAWRPALRAATIPDFRFHDLRHTFASRLMMSGASSYTVQVAGGWLGPSMVVRYTHLSPDFLKAALERLVTGKSEGATGTKTGTSPKAGRR